VSTSVLRIHRWRNEFLVPHDCVAPDRMRADLDDIADDLPDELATGLTPWFSTQGREVVLVKSLVFDCQLDLSQKPELLVERCAYQFAKALINTVESGGDGVLRFASPAAYHAQFIADLTSGHSGSAWYYLPFAGLSALPPASAIRTVLVEDCELGREVLSTLSKEVWNRLGTVLTRIEALRILEDLSGGGRAEAAKPDTFAALYQEHARHLTTVPWFVSALYLFSAALCMGFRASPSLAQWVRLAAKLPALARQTDVIAMVKALQQGDIGTLVAADAERDAESWAILAAQPQWRSTLAELLRVETSRASDTGVHNGAEAVRTTFGGLVLLLPELDNLLDDALSGVFPHTEQASSRGLTAWLVMAQCAGYSCAAQFLHEAFWRDVFGIATNIDLAVLNGWLATGDPTAVSAHLAERARSHARGSPIMAPLRTGGQTLLAIVDQASGLWCDELRNSRPPGCVASPSWRACLAAARRARNDWRYLAMHWGLPEPWQWLFTHMAQIVMRRFAYRVPGFAGTSLPYLYHNLLEGSATLESTGQLRLSRPPLHVLLNLTGIGRGTVLWSGPPERIIQLDYEP
jgi:hypothetical protein